MPELIGERGEVAPARIELRERIAHARAGRVGEQACIVAKTSAFAAQRDRRRVVQPEHVREHAALQIVDVAAGDVAVVGKAVLLLTDGQIERIAEGPLRPQLGEAVVKGLKVSAADHLGVQRQLVEEFALESHPQAAVFETLLIPAVAAINPVLLGVIAAQEPEFLHDRVVLILIHAPEVLELLAERDGGCRRESVVGGPRVKGGGQTWCMQDCKDHQDGDARDGRTRACHEVN